MASQPTTPWHTALEILISEGGYVGGEGRLTSHNRCHSSQASSTLCLHLHAEAHVALTDP